MNQYNRSDMILQKSNILNNKNQQVVTVSVFSTINKVSMQNNITQSQAIDDQTLMMNLIDKLCDHLSNDRIKLFIDNGFDEWQTVTYMKGQELVELGFTSQQVIIIMMAINSNAKQHNLNAIFQEDRVKQIATKAKETQQQKLKEVLEEQKEYANRQNENNQQDINLIKPEQKEQQMLGQIELKQYPKKQLTQSIMEKCIPHKASSTKNIDKDKPSLSKVTLLNLEDKQITHLLEKEMSKITEIQNLYLAHNRIYQLDNSLNQLHKIKVLRLQDNLLTKIQGLQGLINLERLTINENYLQIIQNLGNNKKLNYLNVSNQKHKYSVRFDPKMCYQLSYSLQKLQCNNNRVRNIDAFSNLAVVQEISLKNNKLQEIGQLTTALGQMERLKKIDFKGNPLTKVPKYRDYIVILSKSLEQLDDKKILPKQREYLVKLYSLKHAKQQKEQYGDLPVKKGIKQQINLQGYKMDENEVGIGSIPKYVHGGDLRGNAPYSNTKVMKR